MGLENLRHAKEALKPDHMEEKIFGLLFVSGYSRIVCEEFNKYIIIVNQPK